MNRKECLDSAAEAVLKNRQELYGKPEDGFAGIAAIWSVILGRKIASHEVALCLAALKIVRAANSPTHSDNWVDMAGYAACGSEIATVRQRKVAFDDAKAKQLDAIFSQGTSLTMGVCDDALTDRELQDAIVKNTPDDGQGEPPNVSPKASLCRECGGTQIDGICQEKGCGYEALVPSGADAQTLVSIISRERAKDPTKWGSQEIATLIAKLSQQEANSNEAG